MLNPFINPEWSPSIFVLYSRWLTIDSCRDRFGRLLANCADKVFLLDDFKKFTFYTICNFSYLLNSTDSWPRISTISLVTIWASTSYQNFVNFSQVALKCCIFSNNFAIILLRVMSLIQTFTLTLCMTILFKKTLTLIIS